MGDVLRTTPLLSALKRRYPEGSVTWVVDVKSAPVLEGNSFIDRLLIFSPETLRLISSEAFDLAINLDKENEALDTIQVAQAKIKRGFGWDTHRRRLVPLNPASEYAVRLGLDDELKFRLNQKTYQQISFEQAELPFSREEYHLNISQPDEDNATEIFKSLGLTPRAHHPLIGLNTGSGDRFAGKKLPLSHLVELAKLLSSQFGQKTLLLGGPKEKERNLQIEKLAFPHAVDAGTHHSIKEFAAIVSRLGLVITGDTITLHVAVAVKVPVVAFFGSTCEAEIDLYGRGKKIISSIDCSPCYKRICPIEEKCMSDITLKRILDDCLEVMGEKKPVSR